MRSGWQDHGAKSHSLVAVRTRPAIDTEASLQQLTPWRPAGSLGRGGVGREHIFGAALELGRSGRDPSQHQTDHAQQQATEQAFRDPQDLARDILRALPEVVGCLPREEVEAVLSGLPGGSDVSW